MANITLNQLAYDIMELYRQNYKDTENLDIRQVKYWIQSVRATILAQSADKHVFDTPDDSNTQYYHKIPVQSIDSSGHENYPSNRYVLKTTVEIPNAIVNSDGLGMFTRIGSPDILVPKFNFITYERSIWSGNGKYNNKYIYAYYNNGYIWITSKNPTVRFVKYISIQGVFANPLEFEKLIRTLDPTIPAYNDLVDSYPISMEIATTIKSMVISQNIPIAITGRTDKTVTVEENSDNPQQPYKDNGPSVQER